MGKSYPKTLPINMSQHFTPCTLDSCNCLKKTIAASDVSGPARRTRSSSLRVECSSPPASPLPDLSEVDETEFLSPPTSPLQSEQGEMLDQVAELMQQIGPDQAGDEVPDHIKESSQHHVFDNSRSMSDSRPMVVDEDANDGREMLDQIAESEQQIGPDQTGDELPDHIEESSQRHVFDDSQPMLVDEDANDGYERFVRVM